MPFNPYFIVCHLHRHIVQQACWQVILVTVFQMHCFSLYQSIGVVLMEVATSSQQLWLVAEALDSVMDVFAEDYNNVHIKDLGIIPTLQSILPQLKSMVSVIGGGII